MDRISAAGNLTIEVSPTRWRLLLNGGAPEQALVEAASGQPLRYLPLFAQKRRLPDTGTLPTDYIQRVVLGWSNEDEMWHLGLLLGPELAQVRGSRWCEMARWPDPEANVFGDLATQAGQALAQLLARPFSYVPPMPQGKPVEPARPLPELPLDIDIWKLEKVGQALQFQRASQWSRGKILRALWYLLLVVIYVVLSVASLTQVIALPKPEFLPYLGLAVAVLLLGMALHLLYQVVTTPNRLLVDEEGVRALRGERERWRRSRNDIQSVYVSQIIGKKGKQRTVAYGELNLHLGGGDFRRLFDPAQLQETTTSENEATESIIALRPDDVYTDLQAAGAYIAQRLNVPCWYDRRVR